MNRETIKKLIWPVLIWSALCVVVAFLILFVSANVLMFRRTFGPKTFQFAKASDIPTQDKQGHLRLHRWPEIPATAKDIFLCHGGRDFYLFCAMSLQNDEEISKTAQTLADIPIEKFKTLDLKAKIYYKCSRILQQARNKSDTVLWDISEVKDGLLYEIEYWTEDRRWCSGGKAVVIDPARKRIYYYQWST